MFHWLLGHKWKITHDGFTHLERFYFGRVVFDGNARIFVKKCEKCGKEKAYTESPSGYVESVAIWTAKLYASPV